jgi:hypothetical protein
MTDDSAEERKRKILAEAKAHVAGSWRAEDWPRQPEPSPPVQRRDQVGGVTYKVVENAQVLAPAADETPTSADPWNEWLTRELDRRLEQEREFWIEIIGEVVARERAERAGEQSAEVNAEFAKIWKAICETKKMMVDFARERVERGFRDVGARPGEKMN